jgi:hypothetical protein
MIIHIHEVFGNVGTDLILQIILLDLIPLLLLIVNL